MPEKKIIFLVALIAFGGTAVSFAADGKSLCDSTYTIATAIAETNTGDTLIALRSWRRGDTLRYFCVNPRDLSTSLQPAESLPVQPASFEALRGRFAATPYFRALDDAAKNSAKRQDAGISRILPRRTGIDLTVDLCPSRRPLDTGLFTNLVAVLAATEKPVPLAIAITGRWMEQHPADLQWLLRLVRDTMIAITWVNHSYTHRVDSALPPEKNFLLKKGTNLRFEVLRNELAMLERGLLPSVFFRFPGLISDTAVFDSVIAYGLVPVGSDAWLAKNQRPQNGSIVLVHANGNEPLGVKRFLQLLKSERKNIASKNWVLFDLRESIAEKEVLPPDSAAGVRP